MPCWYSPCTFLEATGAGTWRCSVHPVRPGVCRAFDRCAPLQDRAGPVEASAPEAEAQVAAAAARLRVPPTPEGASGL